MGLLLCMSEALTKRHSLAALMSGLYSPEWQAATAASLAGGPKAKIIVSTEYSE
jgi:hypothetical protein